MLVLGLTGNFSGEYTDLIPGIGRGFFHDAAACLIKDNVVVAAVEEERFNRIKKTTKFPVNAIRACLSTAGVRPPQIDAVCPIGSGDALTAAYAWRMEQPRANGADALRWGVAAGTASARLAGMNFATREQTEEIYRQVEVRRVE